MPEESLGKSLSILGSGEEFDETQLCACCGDLPGEVLNTRWGIYIINTEGMGEDYLW